MLMCYQVGADSSRTLSSPPASGANAREQPERVGGAKAAPNYALLLLEISFPPEKLLDATWLLHGAWVLQFLRVKRWQGQEDPNLGCRGCGEDAAGGGELSQLG